MSNSNFDNLPPELQQRIAGIIQQAQQPQAPVQQAAPAPAPAAAPAPEAPKPNLMDHVIMLRQEVAEMRQQLQAVAQVTDAVGQAVGQMYAMFQSQTEPSSASAAFQEGYPSQQLDEDY